MFFFQSLSASVVLENAASPFCCEAPKIIFFYKKYKIMPDFHHQGDAQMMAELSFLSELVL